MTDSDRIMQTDRDSDREYKKNYSNIKTNLNTNLSLYGYTILAVSKDNGSTCIKNSSCFIGKNSISE